MNSRPVPDDRILADLPLAYAVALRLRRTGASDAQIGHVLDVPVEAVPVLLAVGEAKVDELRRHRRGP